MPIWRGTTNTDWNTASNWVVDGSGNSGVPTATTDAIFDSTSTNPCVMGGNRSCRDLIFSGFTSTLTVATFNLAVYRSLSLQSDIASRVIGTTGTLQMALTTGGTALNGTITPNSGIWPLNFLGGGASVTITLAANFTVSGNVTIGTGPTYSGNTFSCEKDFSSSGGGSLASSATNFKMIGTGTMSLGGRCNMEIDTIGTITVLGNISTDRRFIITNVGTLNGLSAVNFTFVPSAASNTLDFGAGNRSVQDFSTNTVVGTTTTILNSFTCRDLSLIGTNTYNGPTSPSTAKITVTRSYTHSNTAITNGTLLIEMTGSSGGALLNGNITSIPVIINAGVNTITYGVNFSILNGANFTRISGSINPGSTTITIPNILGGNCTISNIIFNNFTILPNIIVTQNVENTINGTLTCSNIRFSGISGWRTANLTNTTAGTTMTLESGVNYTVTSNLFLLGTNSSPIIFSSSSLSTRAYLTLDYGATQTVYFVRATRIDSSLGQTIWNSFGTISNPLNDTINWNGGSKPAPMVYTFIT